MNKKSLTPFLSLLLTGFIVLSCKSNSSGQDNTTATASESKLTSEQEQTLTVAAKKDNQVIAIDCESLGLKELVQQTCGLTAAAEKNTMEVKGETVVVHMHLQTNPMEKNSLS